MPPIIEEWRDEPLKDLPPGELVELDRDLVMVQPGAAYMARQGVETTSRRMHPVKPIDWGEQAPTVTRPRAPVDPTQELIANGLMKDGDVGRKRKSREDPKFQKKAQPGTDVRAEGDDDWQQRKRDNAEVIRRHNAMMGGYL